MTTETLHPPGMLTRDQRTAFTTVKSLSEAKRASLHIERVISVRYGIQPFHSVPKNSIIALEPQTNTSDSKTNKIASEVDNSQDDRWLRRRPVDSQRSRTRKYKSYARRFSKKFGEVLACLCLLAVLQTAAWRTVHAAPAGHHHQPHQRERHHTMATQRHQRALPDQPKWINPCGIMGTNSNSMSQDMMPVVHVTDLLQQIVIQAKNALGRAEESKEEYVLRTFKVDFQQHHQSWKTYHYDWLMTSEVIPKGLDEEVPSDHLESIQESLDDTLLRTYKYLQGVAVGLEQVASDQTNNEGQFQQLFQSSEYGLRAVLCEIQTALLERQIQWGDDVKRSIMGDEYRHIEDNTYRDLRDWFIYRDYMNALQYIIQVYEYYANAMA